MKEMKNQNTKIRFNENNKRAKEGGADYIIMYMYEGGQYNQYSIITKEW